MIEPANQKAVTLLGQQLDQDWAEAMAFITSSDQRAVLTLHALCAKEATAAIIHLMQSNPVIAYAITRAYGLMVMECMYRDAKRKEDDRANPPDA